MAITAKRAISGPAIIAGLGGGNAVGTNATATGATLINSLSTGNATNPNLVIQVGVKTSSGAVQATATTALTIVGETLAATFVGAVAAPSLALGGATIGTNALAVTGTATVSTSLAIGGATIGSNALAIAGHVLIEGVTSTGATGAGAFVFATSPALVTPALGVATATTLAIGGATIGTDALGVTGTATISGTLTVPAVRAASATIVTLSTDGKLKFSNSGGTAGGVFDGTTAGTIKARNLADNAFSFLQGKIASEQAATTGLAAGVLAALTNATVVFYDANGQAYRFPCII